MKKITIPLALVLMATFLSSCSAIEGIFKAGAVTGIIAVIVAIALIIWVISMFRGKS